MRDGNERRWLSWNDIREYTPSLFLYDENARPPEIARRLWAAINAWGLNEYGSPREESSVKSLLITLAMIFQEFQALARLRHGLLCPTAMAEFLGIPSFHIEEIIAENKVIPAENDPLANVLLLDSMNRGDVAEAILDHFEDEHALFWILAFPRGLSEEERRMPLDELLAGWNDRWSADDADLAQIAVVQDWQAGFTFIESRFERVIKYGGK